MNENENTAVKTTSKDTVSQVDKDAAELASLKQRAATMKLKFHPNIGLDKLRERVNEQLNKPAEQVVKEKAAPAVQAAPPLQHVDELPKPPVHNRRSMGKPESSVERKIRLRKEASKLIRIRITCMNPAKKNWKGEIFTVSNSSAGTFKKYIPFNIDEGWHIPQIMLNFLQERKFSEHYVAGKDARGRDIKRFRLVREFAIEIMEPLTAKELEDLRIKQAMAGTVGKD